MDKTTHKKRWSTLSRLRLIQIYQHNFFDNFLYYHVNQMKIILYSQTHYSTSLFRECKTIEHNLQNVHQDHDQNC